MFTVTSSQNPSVAGQAVTLTVTMTPVSTGATLDSAYWESACRPAGYLERRFTSITTPDLSPGTHTVTGVWAGDAKMPAGSSAVLTQTVQAIATTTSLTASPNPSASGGAVNAHRDRIAVFLLEPTAFSNNGVAVATANLVAPRYKY